MRILKFPETILHEETEAYHLKDCSLVVDALQYFYNTYEESGIPYVFGSEADKHAKHMFLTKLNKFKKANVKCYFVFKGGCTDIKKNLHKYDEPKFDINSNYKFVAPVFFREICLQMVESNGFNYATCVTESKDDIVALAQRLGCPILSYNLEYCFQSVPYVMSLQYYKEPNDHIVGRQYNLQKFLNKHSLTVENFALFGTLSDVHLFPRNYFDNLLQTWDVCDDNMYERNKKLLKWLSEHNADETLITVTNFILDVDEKMKFVTQMNKLLANMQNKDRYPSVAMEYLYNDCKLTVYRQDPLWFEKGVATQNIAIPYINLYKHQFIRGSCAIEEKTSIDSIMLSIDIIKYALNLLTNYKTNQISIYQDKDNYVSVSTKDLNIKRAKYQCKASVFENGWAHIKSLNLFEHFLSENNINVDINYYFPADGRLLLIALAYFARKKHIDVTKEVYCYIIYFMISKELSKQRLNINDTNNGYGITVKDRNEAVQVTQKYFELVENEEKEIFNESVLKTLVEFQYCLLHINYLNTLCGTPYKPTVYRNTINGTFVYKLLHDMRDCDVDVFVNNLFKDAPSFLKLLKGLTSTYNDIKNTKSEYDFYVNVQNDCS